MRNHEELRRAFSVLASLRLSREEKLRRIELLLDTIPPTSWEDVFALMRDIKELRLNILTIKDLILLLLKFKDFKGLHQLKQRIYLLVNRLPFLFNVRWRRFPLGVVVKGPRVIRRSSINPLPGDIYSSLGNLVTKRIASITEVHGTEIIRRGEKYNRSLDSIHRKFEPYPNIRRFFFRELSDVVKFENWEAKREVRRLERELQPAYLRFEQPTIPMEIVNRFEKVSRDVLEQAFIISQYCARSEEEGKSLKMGIIIGDHEKVIETLDTPLVEKISNDLFLREEEWVRIRREISRKANGVVATLVVNGEDGRILDAIAMGELTYSEITSRTDAVAFKISQNCVRIISNGELQYQHVLNRKIGRWSLRNVQQIKKVVNNLAIEKGLNHLVLNKITEVAFKISETKEAMLYVIGRFSELKRCLTKESKDRLLMLRPKNVLNIPENELINYSREDGAIVIDENGMLLVVEAYFTGGGGRHEVARRVTQRCPKSISIVVSKDATVSIYDKGHLTQEIL